MQIFVDLTDAYTYNEEKEKLKLRYNILEIDDEIFDKEDIDLKINGVVLLKYGSIEKYSDEENIVDWLYENGMINYTIEKDEYKMRLKDLIENNKDLIEEFGEGVAIFYHWLAEMIKKNECQVAYLVDG